MQVDQIDSMSVMTWTWADYKPIFDELHERELTAETAESFLSDWSKGVALVGELRVRSMVATQRNTADEAAKEQYRRYNEDVFPNFEAADQLLREKVIAAGVSAPGFEVPLQQMGAKAALFRAENLTLLGEEKMLAAEYAAITGAQTVPWQGKDIPRSAMAPFLRVEDRKVREQAWRAVENVKLQDRERLDGVWQRLLELRLQIARNADFDNYRDYKWQELMRFDYGPELNISFHRAAYEVAGPAIGRTFLRRQKRLGLSPIRPWDTWVDAILGPPLHPAGTSEELQAGLLRIFRNVDPEFGRQFERMIDEDMLDLESRQNKAPGGVCFEFPVSGLPYIITNTSGIHSDVEVVLHEGGHAFHAFECCHLPYFVRGMNLPSEFAEVASTSMELLAGPYLESERGGFYSKRDAARARIQTLEFLLYSWVWVAMIDSFQHWAYENPGLARVPDHCDQTWTELTLRYLPFDWTGLEEYVGAEWRNVLHIVQLPFYAIEYAMAGLAAVSVWSQSLKDQSRAVDRYRSALARGGALPLPQLYEAVGAPFDFSTETLGSAVQLIEQTLLELEQEAESA